MFKRAFSHQNYRLFFFGQGVSLVGTWMQQIAMTWLVYHVTKSEWLLGVVSFAGQIPTFFVAPFAGVLTDRWNRHRTLIVTQTLAMLQAFLMAALTYMHLISVPQIIVLACVLGLINAFDMPTRQSFLNDIVTRKEDLPNAIALNSSMVNGARLIGPAFAGVVIGFSGEAVCFLLNGVSYLAVIWALLRMRLNPHRKPARVEPVWLSLKEGLSYSFKFPPIRSILILLSLTSVTSVSLSTLLPVFASKLFTTGASGLGALSAVSGAGALCGAIFLATRKTILGLGRIIAIATAMLGLGMMLFSYSEREGISLACLFMTGAGNIMQMAACNSLLQVIAEDTKRGRVLSFYIVSLLGVAPIGSLLAGYLGSTIGASATVGITGLLTVISSIIFQLHLPRMRAMVLPIYIQHGIVPVPAEDSEKVLK